MAHQIDTSEPSSYHDADAEDNAQRIPTDEASPSKRQKVRLLASRAKSRIKELPDLVASRGDGNTSRIIDGEKDDIDDDEANLSDDPAFNPGPILDGSLERSPPKPPNNKGGKLKQAGNAIIHPRQAMREKTTQMTATKISESQRPYLSPEQDLELLRADDDLARADSSSSSIYHGEGITENNQRQKARARLQNIQENRESLKSAWIIGRHVVRVRAIPKPAERPERQKFVTNVSHDQQRLEWEKWLGHLCLWYTRGFTTQYIDDFGDRPPFDVHELARIVERLALVSAPWQTFFLEVRSIYTWKDTKQTGKWCALFWFLWYTDHLVGFLYAYIIYLTLRNRLYPTSIDSVRKAMARGIDREKKAQAWGELIEKHGKSDWVEPLVADIGPLIQMQLGDLTNFIEVMTNFYRWERPSKTAGTLFYYFCCLLITLLADIRFCVRLVWFIIGGGFFFCWPIATRFPQYRLLVDPLRWLFWDIPTHAELGFIQLQEKAILKDSKDLEEATTVSYNDTPSDSDYFSADEGLSVSQPGRKIVIRAYNGKHRGHLTLNRHSLKFSSHYGPTITTPLANMTEMRKMPIDGKAERLVTFQSQTEGLAFDFRPNANSEIETLSVLVRRSDQHRIFNHILAWSGLKWQSLHLQRHPAAEEGRKEVDKAIKNIVHG